MCPLPIVGTFYYYLDTMIGYSQAYYYVNECPLQGIERDPMKYTVIGEWMRQNVGDILLKIVDHQDYIKANVEFDRRIKELSELSKIYDLHLKIKLFQNAAVHTHIFTLERLSDKNVTFPGEFSIKRMKALVDIARVKPNKTIELIWFNYNTVFPDISQQNVLSFFAQWNARAYELKYNKRPYQLTVFFPLLGDSVQFVYNPNNGLEVVAELIERNAFFIRPSKERCRSCRLCPEYERME